VLFLSSCRDVKEPTFREVENLRIGKADLSSTSVTADIRFDNPNRFALQLRSIDCDVYVDSTFLGHFTNTEEVHIPSQQEFLLPVKGDVSTSQLISYSGRALLQIPSPIRVEGKARIGRSGFYKTIPFNYRDTIILKL